MSWLRSGLLWSVNFEQVLTLFWCFHCWNARKETNLFIFSGFMTCVTVLLTSGARIFRNVVNRQMHVRLCKICTKSTIKIQRWLHGRKFQYHRYLKKFPISFKCLHWVPVTCIPVSNYLLKVNNRNTRKKCQICSKLTTKTSERCLASSWCLYC